MEGEGRGGGETLSATPTATDISNSRSPIAPAFTTTTGATTNILTESQKPNLIMSETETFKTGQVPGSPGVGGGGWDDIRELDNAENWTERTRVISKQDHQFYSQCAQGFVSELVDKLPDKSTKEDYNDYGITGDNEVPNSRSPSNPSATTTGRGGGGDFGYMDQFDDRDFQLSASQFNTDYFERMGSNTNTTTSALARESLYVKFDPLVGPVVPARTTPPLPPPMSGDNLLMLNTPPTATFTKSSVIGSEATPQTGTRDLMQSPNLLHMAGGNNDNMRMSPFASQSPFPKTLLDTSSSPSSNYLIGQSPSANPNISGPGLHLPPARSSLEGNPELVKVLKYTDYDLQRIIAQVRQEAQAEIESQVLAVREEYSQEFQKSQKKMDRLVKELQNLRSNNALQTSSNSKMEEECSKLKALCDEHLATEKKMLDMYEKLKEESRQIEQQRDQALADFNSMEKSFADFHQRHIKARETLTLLQKSESSLQDHIAHLEKKVESLEEMNQQLQDETFLKIQEANKIYDKLQSDHASELAVTKANVKKMTVQISSLEGQLKQKEQEKQELTLICDELMKELGSK